VDMLFASDEECENFVDSFSSSSDESVINESDSDDESPLVTPTSSNTWSSSKVFTPHAFHFDSSTSGIYRTSKLVQIVVFSFGRYLYAQFVLFV
jgi:hypothetical protein